MLKPVAYGISDVGRVRDHNEDSYLINDEVGLFIVADGMGGHAAGEVASAEAVEQVYGMVKKGVAAVDDYRRNPADTNLLAKVHRLVESAIQMATYMVFGMAEVDPEQQGMGTTISTMLWSHDRAVIGQVGDSRVYLIRGGAAYQVTEDHTLVNMQVKAGILTPEQAKKARHGNLITRAVGLKDYVQVDLINVLCNPGDRFLLCSDGLSDYLQSEAEVAQYVGQGDLATVGQNLVNMANSRGGKDNITALIVEMVPA
jgi:serine/threonine protein phosphatase PrpC